VIEKPLPQPATIEDDFNAHYAPKAGADASAKSAE
jgi:ubiquinol-cytochrome c reductase cytochrome b subunit